MSTTQWKGKFINVNLSQIKIILKKIKAKKTEKKHLHKYVIFVFPEYRDRRQVRIKKSSEHVTLSIYKDDLETNEYRLDIYVRVSSYDKTIDFLQKMGMVNKRHREYYRSTWTWKGVKVQFYTYPGLPTFIRVVATDHNMAKKLLKQLELQFNNAIYYETEVMYAKMFDTTPDKVLDLKEIRFDNIDNIGTYFVREAKRDEYKFQKKTRRRRDFEGRLLVKKNEK